MTRICCDARGKRYLHIRLWGRWLDVYWNVRRWRTGRYERGKP